MITLSDEELLEKAKSLLDGRNLSGGSIDLLERILTEGFADSPDALFEIESSSKRDLEERIEEAEHEGRLERGKIRDLCVLHQIL